MAAFYPFALSVFAAFIPDLEKFENMRRPWRIAIIIGGLIYSLILWHQQSLNITAGRHDQLEIVTRAVSESNRHADQRISEVRGDIQQDSQRSDERINAVRDDLKKTLVGMSGLISDTKSDIGSAISKVNKPDPPEHARLKFSLWGDNIPVNSQLLSTSLKPDADGVFVVDFNFSNTSSVSAVKIDFWINICDDCVYAKEPSDFDRPSGLDERIRHRFLAGTINPGASYQKTTIQVKPPKSSGSFEIGFRYSCETCGEIGELQKAKIVALPN
jgi:hypothetical protein